jgi:hypothetical protein
MEFTQITSTSNPVAEIGETKPKRSGNNRKPYFRLYYQKNQPKYLQSNRKYRQKLKLLKPQTPRSAFSLLREKNFLRCLNKHHIIVPILRLLKIKHPTIKN